MELTRKLLGTTALTLADQRQVEVICSTPKPDRMGDVVVQAGINLGPYGDNPVVLWNHLADVPVARTINIDIKTGQLRATVQFPPEGDDEDSDWVYGKIKAGLVNATSIGFIPKDYEPLNPKEPWGGYKFKTSELLEFSFVSVPANSGCLIVGRSLFNGIDIPLLPSLARRMKAPVGAEIADDNLLNDIRIPRNIAEELFRLAKTPRTMRQKYLGKSAAADWKVGAADDLLVADAETWDGAAAAKRILDDAGFDGDSPDAAKAARGFLIHDAANPVLRSSYKLPFADIVDGELKAIKSGVIAAQARLAQTEAPADVLDEAKEIADEYEQKDVVSVETIIAPVEKSGRKISGANEALLQKAMDHHASATKCIKDVLDSNAAADPDGDDDNAGPDADAVPVVVVLSAEDMRTQRLAEAKALKASVKI
jgi:HK97 family phage prohead protease